MRVERDGYLTRETPRPLVGLGPVAGDRPEYRPVDQCSFCRHRELEKPVCDAFPDGIPIVIILNKHDHHDPYPGDHGIRFDPIPPAATTGAVRFFRVFNITDGLVGALWLGTHGEIGFEPTEGHEDYEAVWNGRMRVAWHAGGQPGKFFEHWLNAGNSVSWDTAPSEIAVSLANLRERLAK